MTNSTNLCPVENCKNPLFAKGLCSTHYARWKRHGNVNVNLKKLSLGVKFWRHVFIDSSVENSCWVWVGCICRGYGHFVTSQQPTVIVKAHRFSYESLVGKIPDGLTIDHLCRNKACVNPNHLEPVTMRINVLRGTSIVANNAAKKQCDHGHSFDKKNTYVYKSGPRKGARKCRTCERIRMQKTRSSRRASN